MIESVTYGGLPPYSFAWSDGNNTDSYRLGLPKGVYEVTVTDAANCSFTTDIYVGVADNCVNTKSNWPYQNALEGGTGLFRQNNDDNRNWAKRSNNTPTSSTGPSAAAEGTFYRYFESSGNNGNPNKTAVLTTRRCLNLSNLTNPAFEFKYHMRGVDMGRLSIQIHDGIGWTNSIWKKEGDLGNTWHQASIDLSAYQNTPIRLRIVGYTGNGPRSDMAIDDLWIRSATQAPAFNQPEVLQELQSVVSESLTNPEFSIYPNPAKDFLNIQLNKFQVENSIIYLMDALGNRIKQQVRALNQSMQININDLSPGLYYVTIQSSDQQLATQKLIITQ